MLPSRRSLLTLGSTLFLPFEAFSTESLAGRIRLGLKYHMIDEPDLSVVEKFRLLTDIGYDGVEVKTTEKVDPADIEKAVSETGVKVHGIINAGSTDIETPLELAKRFDCETILVFAGTQKNQSYEENFKFWQNLIRKSLPLAEKNEIVICIENVKGTFLKEAEEMARFIDSFDSPLVKSYFDLGNTITWTDQSAEHWASVLGKRIHKLDIKDRGHSVFGDPKLKKKGIVTGTNGGEVNWNKVREILIENEFEGWAAAEVQGGDRERLEGIIEWMRDVLNL